MSIELVMPSNRLILCRPLFLLPSIFPNLRVFSYESALRIRWPKYWSFSFNISPSFEYPGLISFRILIKCETLVHSRSSFETPARKFWRRQWHPTPVLLPGEFQGWGSLVGCCLWGCTESDTTDVT